MRVVFLLDVELTKYLQFPISCISQWKLLAYNQCLNMRTSIYRSDLQTFQYIYVIFHVHTTTYVYVLCIYIYILPNIHLVRIHTEWVYMHVAQKSRSQTATHAKQLVFWVNIVFVKFFASENSSLAKENFIEVWRQSDRIEIASTAEFRARSRNVISCWKI